MHIILSIAVLFYILFFKWVFKNYKHSKNEHKKIKQEAKERAESDRIFKQTISEIFDDGEESFAETELMATSL